MCTVVVPQRDFRLPLCSHFLPEIICTYVEVKRKSERYKNEVERCLHVRNDIRHEGASLVHLLWHLNLWTHGWWWWWRWDHNTRSTMIVTVRGEVIFAVSYLQCLHFTPNIMLLWHTWHVWESHDLVENLQWRRTEENTVQRHDHANNITTTCD